MSDCTVYTGLSYEDYDKIDALRQSWLSRLADSPAHLKWHLDHTEEESEESDALKFGGAFDTAVFFPEEFARQYVVMPKFDRRTKEGKASVAAFEFDNTGKKFLSEREYQDVLAMARSVTQSKAAMSLLTNAEYQLTIVWTDDATGVRCKSRLDAYNGPLLTPFDLKTTRCVRAFRRSISDYGYHRQAAMYMEACKQAGLDAEHFCFIAVDKIPPFPVKVLRLSDLDIKQAWESCKKLLRTYRNCMIDNVWPSYPDRIEDIALTEWERAHLMED